MKIERGSTSAYSGRDGFTLIELLIVIAIIGILSSVIIASLNSSRYKANDADVKQILAQVRNAAEIFYNSRNPEGYNGTSGNVQWKCDDANSMFTDSQSGMIYLVDPNNYPNNTDLRCSSNQNAYEVSASLTQNLGGPDPDFWCVNSAGFAGIIEAHNHTQAHPNNDTDCTP